MEKLLREKIEKRAWEIYQYRQENCIGGSNLDDWFQAESEIITDRRIEGCPLCGSKLLARNNGEIFCLKEGCSFKIKAKRKQDSDISNFNQIKKVWQ